MVRRTGRGSAGGAPAYAVPLVISAALALLGILFLYSNGTLANLPMSVLPSSSIPGYTTTQGSTSASTTAYTTVPSGNQSGSSNFSDSNSTQLSLYEYTLSLINNDRKTYGLGPVTLSGTLSGQQHATNMLEYGYLSHWDIYGMKPYMRYTLLDGRGSVAENVAYITNESCSIFGCTGNINVESAIKNMEYSMMYNDSQCCNNGHRDNILDPNHNQVSLGIAYNSSTVYLVEDFIDNYIGWGSGYPSYSNSNETVSLDGAVQSGYNIYEVLVSYDPPVQRMSVAQLRNTSSYSYGQEVAGVASSPYFYYTGVDTIVADQYYTQGNGFDISFSLANLTRLDGAGEYTIMIWLNGTSGGSSFIGSTYTIFLNANGSQYVPNGI